MCLPLTPFKIEREWKHAGLSCSVVLAREGGHRCGYVRVPPTHPLYNKDYNTPDVDVHGGLTFAEIEECKEHADGQGWWFGFDCAHCMDAYYDPNARLEDMTTEEGRARFRIEQQVNRGFPFGTSADHYWTEAEVAAECERLADQLAALS